MIKITMKKIFCLIRAFSFDDDVAKIFKKKHEKNAASNLLTLFAKSSLSCIFLSLVMVSIKNNSGAAFKFDRI